MIQPRERGYRRSKTRYARRLQTAMHQLPQSLHGETFRGFAFQSDEFAQNRRDASELGTDGTDSGQEICDGVCCAVVCVKKKEQWGGCFTIHPIVSLRAKKSVHFHLQKENKILFSCCPNMQTTVHPVFNVCVNFQIYKNGQLVTLFFGLVL